MNRKKQRELDFLKMFKEVSTYKFTIEDTNRESPDFIIDYKNKKIGVEVTEYFIDLNTIYNRGSQLKQKESTKQSIIDSALKAYQEKALPPIIVHVKFISGQMVSLNTKEKISKILVQSLSKVDIEFGENKNIIDRNSLNDLSKYFSLLYVQKSPNHINSWQIMNFGIVNDVSEEQIRNIIKLKEEKIHLYQKSANFNWLIIASDGSNPSSMIDRSNKLNFKVETKFEKVFFLTYPEPKCFAIHKAESN